MRGRLFLLQHCDHTEEIVRSREGEGNKRVIIGLDRQQIRYGGDFELS